MRKVINFILLVAEGELSLIDLITKAYIYAKTKILIISVIQYMPSDEKTFSQIMQTIVGVIGSVIIPVSLSIQLPLQLYAMIIEKENGLVEIMQINGLKLR